MKIISIIFLLFSLGANAQNENLRGADSSAYILIDATQNMGSAPQYYFTMKSPKGDTVKYAILMYWDSYSRYWHIKTSHPEGDVGRYLTKGKQFWLKDGVYFFNDDLICKIYKNH